MQKQTLESNTSEETSHQPKPTPFIRVTTRNVTFIFYFCSSIAAKECMNVSQAVFWKKYAISNTAPLKTF